MPATPSPPADPFADLSGIPASAPDVFVALRIVATYAESTRRVDLRVEGTRTTIVEEGPDGSHVARQVDTDDLWPTVRELLPPLAHLRADPTSGPPPPRRPPPTPGEGFAGECLAMVTIATLTETGLTETGVTETGPDTTTAAAPVIRAWLATADELWAATPLADGSSDLRPAHPGAVADTLVWDLSGALERLVGALEHRLGTP